ncbi:MAG: hypothetical protein MUE34_12345 [Acidimicrobiales bacterium]|jgi:hypothetical protein|nr:hypothetical protein [Acidimicrobiales bacterium]
MSGIEAIGGVHGSDATFRLDPTRVAQRAEQERIVNNGGVADSTSSGGSLGRYGHGSTDTKAGMRELAKSLHVDESVLADGLGSGRTLSQVLHQHGVTDSATMPVQLQGVMFDRYL